VSLSNGPHFLKCYLVGSARVPTTVRLFVIARASTNQGRACRHWRGDRCLRSRRGPTLKLFAMWGRRKSSLNALCCRDSLRSVGSRSGLRSLTRLPTRIFVIRLAAVHSGRERFRRTRRTGEFHTGGVRRVARPSAPVSAPRRLAVSAAVRPLWVLPASPVLARRLPHGDSRCVVSRLNVTAWSMEAAASLALIGVGLVVVTI